MFIKRNTVTDTFQVISGKVAPVSQLSTRWLLRCLLNTRQYAAGRLLDIGCGEKPYKDLFPCNRHIGGDWPGSQHSSESIDVHMDAVRLPFNDESFDTVLMTEALEHIAEPGKAVNEIGRVLRPGGYLILSAPFAYLIHEAPYDYLRYTHYGLEHILKERRLEIAEEYTRGGALSVSVDVCTRAVSMIISQVLKRIGISQGMIRRLLFWTLGLAQIAAVNCLFTCHTYASRLANLLDPANRLTLGYVIVAVKRRTGSSTTYRQERCAE